MFLSEVRFLNKQLEDVASAVTVNHLRPIFAPKSHTPKKETFAKTLTKRRAAERIRNDAQIIPVVLKSGQQLIAQG